MTSLAESGAEGWSGDRFHLGNPGRPNQPAVEDVTGPVQMGPGIGSIHCAIHFISGVVHRFVNAFAGVFKRTALLATGEEKREGSQEGNNQGCVFDFFHQCSV
jgi:hypothetical protein